MSSQGQYVELVNSKKEIEEVYAFFAKKDLKRSRTSTGISYLLQQYISVPKNDDYRVFCVNKEVVGAIRREAVKGFKANISLGGTAKRTDIDDELRALVGKIIEGVDFFYTGIDFIKTESGYLAIEINLRPQFEGFEKATGINVAGKIVDALIEKSGSL